MDWEDIRVLGQLAESGTVRGAAKALKLHHSTISRRVVQLEHAACVRLFDRTPDGYVLTEAGEHLARSAKRMDEEVIRAGRLISGGDKEMAGRILVTMPESIAVHSFAPKLPEFSERYPNLEVDIKSTTSVVDLSRRKADVAIRMSNNPPESLFGKRLFPYYIAVYATPDYLASHDFNAYPERARWIGWDGTHARFPQWTADTPFARVPVWGNYPAPELQTALAAAGAGLAMLPCFL